MKTESSVAKIGKPGAGKRACPMLDWKPSANQSNTEFTNGGESEGRLAEFLVRQRGL